MSCDECGGYLMPYSGGEWVSIKKGDTRSRTVYCIDCEAVYTIEQKVIASKKIGYIDDS